MKLIRFGNEGQERPGIENKSGEWLPYRGGISIILQLK